MCEQGLTLLSPKARIMLCSHITKFSPICPLCDFGPLLFCKREQNGDGPIQPVIQRISTETMLNING